MTINQYTDQAVTKLEQEKNAVAGNKEKAMADAVLAALKDFCRQSDSFAQAVATGGSFANCMKAVAKGTGMSISDLDAYRKAVQFYFKDADIEMRLTIRLPQDQTATPTRIVLDLMDFFQ